VECQRTCILSECNARQFFCPVPFRGGRGSPSVERTALLHSLQLTQKQSFLKGFLKKNMNLRGSSICLLKVDSHRVINKCFFPRVYKPLPFKRNFSSSQTRRCRIILGRLNLIWFTYPRSYKDVTKLWEWVLMLERTLP